MRARAADGRPADRRRAAGCPVAQSGAAAAAKAAAPTALKLCPTQPLDARRCRSCADIDSDVLFSARSAALFDSRDYQDCTCHAGPSERSRHAPPGSALDRGLISCRRAHQGRRCSSFARSWRSRILRAGSLAEDAGPWLRGGALLMCFDETCRAWPRNACNSACMRAGTRARSWNAPARYPTPGGRLAHSVSLASARG